MKWCCRAAPKQRSGGLLWTSGKVVPTNRTPSSQGEEPSKNNQQTIPCVTRNAGSCRPLGETTETQIKLNRESSRSQWGLPVLGEVRRMQLHHIWLCIGKEWDRMQFRACKATKRPRQPFHACLRICTVCASATQSNSVGSCEEGNHTRMSVVLAPNAVTRPQMCAMKVPGDVLSTAAFLHARAF